MEHNILTNNFLVKQVFRERLRPNFALSTMEVKIEYKLMHEVWSRRIKVNLKITPKLMIPLLATLIHARLIKPSIASS